MPAENDVLSSITCFTQDETLLANSVSTKMKRSPRWFGKLPAAVVLDKRLSSDAVRVYAVLTLKTMKGTVATLGMRHLGSLIGLSPATVMRRLKELVAAGHLTHLPVGKGKRGRYEFTSPCFDARPQFNPGLSDPSYYEDRPKKFSNQAVVKRSLDKKTRKTA